MATIVRDGVELYYEVAGQGSPVVLSHAFGNTSQMWRAQVERLRERYRVISWDMRGHGQSASPEEQSSYSMAATCDDLGALLDDLGVEAAVLGGLSLGGYLSLSYYLKHPSRVRALMLFDTGPGFREPAARQRWNDLAFQRADEFERGSIDSRGLALAARGMLAQFDSSVIEGLGKVSVPTLVLVGENDARLLPAANYLCENVPQAQKVVIPGAGHLSNLDQPEAFNRAVVDFLDALP